MFGFLLLGHNASNVKENVSTANQLFITYSLALYRKNQIHPPCQSSIKDSSEIDCQSLDGGCALFLRFSLGCEGHLRLSLISGCISNPSSHVISFLITCMIGCITLVFLGLV